VGPSYYVAPDPAGARAYVLLRTRRGRSGPGRRAKVALAGQRDSLAHACAPATPGWVLRHAVARRVGARPDFAFLILDIDFSRSRTAHGEPRGSTRGPMASRAG